MVRLFVGIPLPEETRELLAAAQESLLGIPDVKTAATSGLHLTLKFFGEVAEHDVPRLIDALSRVKHPTLSLVIDGAGSFGEPPRVIFADVRDDPLLTDLARKIDAATPMVRSEEKFIPHVTLARCRDGARVDVRTIIVPMHLFPVDRFVLYRSDATKDGQTYTMMREFPLTG